MWLCNPPGGAYIPPGWHKLVLNLAKALVAAGFTGKVLQVKSKFGNLRFYIDAGTEKHFELIAKAETASRTICEVCGDPGTCGADSEGRFATLCATCRS